MKIEHHLSDPLLLSYAAGNLAEAFSLVVATHVSMCDDCRARLMSFEALGGSVLAGPAEDGVALDSDALDICLAGLDRQEQPPPPPRRSARSAGGLPAPLARYAGASTGDIRWKSVGNGIRQAVLKTGPGGASARMLYIPAGCAVPDHGHGGMELTLVLQGAFRDASARFGPGDVEIANSDTDHKPVAEPGQDCICLAATDAPLRFSGFLPRLLQPFFRI